MSNPFEPPVEGGGSSCYRHPDRETFIRCTRCDQYICPECMIPASVGFQCVECVSVGAREVRRVRTVLGGRPTASARVTVGIVAVSIAAFVLQMVIGVNRSAVEFGLVPGAIAIDNQWWRLLSPVLLHGGLLHLFFNMYVLWMLGQQLERVLGHARFAALYAVSALGGSAASYAFSSVATVSVGASGAVFGLMSALVITGRFLRYDVSQALVLIGINTVIGFVVPGIDWRAHLGGLVAGAAVAFVYARAPKVARSAWQGAGVASVVAMIAALVVWRTAQILALVG